MSQKGNAILIVEDETNLRSLLSKILSLEGHTVYEAGDVASGKEILRRERIFLVLTDVMLPDSNGIEFTKFVRAEFPLIEVIVLTAFGNIKDGVRAMKLGAFDYLTKGDGDDRLPIVVRKAMDKAVLNHQVQEMEFRLNSKSSFGKIIGKSRAMHDTIELAKKVAVTDTTVLILGETGTGKELISEAIHLASRRRKGPFIPINCAAIPKDLQESELFGHKKGAFTGAVTDKKGYFEVADRGTIFLDELGEMSPELQAKLLRVLETKTFNRVGDTQTIPVDIRIIAATNRDLVSEDNDAFRRDLYYRLSAFTIDLPPLRERKDDIDLLVMHLIKENAERTHKEVDNIDSAFMEQLKKYDWPGNIRELKNVVERAVILTDGPELTVDTLPREILNGHADAVLGKRTSANGSLNGSSLEGPATNGAPLKPENGTVDLKSVEQKHILRVLEMVNGNKSEAAKRLDIGLATLYRKLKEYNIST